MNVVRPVRAYTCGLSQSRSAPGSPVSTSLRCVPPTCERELSVNTKQNSNHKIYRSSRETLHRSRPHGTQTYANQHVKERGPANSSISHGYYTSARSQGHNPDPVQILCQCNSDPHTPRPHFDSSLAVKCQTRRVAHKMRADCSFTEPRQSVGGCLARAKDVASLDKFHAWPFHRQSNLCCKRTHEGGK